MTFCLFFNPPKSSGICYGQPDAVDAQSWDRVVKLHNSIPKNSVLKYNIVD